MGPLAGTKIIELAGIGPGPMAAMLLGDLGATVLRIDRKTPADLGTPRPVKYNPMLRNRKSIALDLKDPQSIELVLRLVEGADALIEGFRPGVTERLGLGPEPCMARNARLVYGRITGWGQTGPLATAAGHDLNYIALTGALHAIGRQGQPPTPPLNVLGDFAGGSLYLALGLLAAMLEARQSGKGQVVDAAIVDGTTSLMASFYGQYAGGLWNLERGTNRTDSGAYFYGVYECADGLWVSVAAMEARFFAELLRRMEIDPSEIGNQLDRKDWPKAQSVFERKFKTRTRGQWCELLEGTDACFAPVLSMAEAPQHPHMQARRAFVEVDGTIQPAPAPRFSRTVPSDPVPPLPVSPENAQAALSEWLPEAEFKTWRANGIV